jgi:FKBP-type peptidyl-prolyl cis-trans isomerase SlyD
VAPSSIKSGVVVYIHYTLKNPDGETLESSVGDDPMPYLHGAGNIVPGLEAALDGHAVGDRVAVLVPPEEGYGLRDDAGVKPVPRTAMPDVELVPGLALVAENDEGDRVPVWIHEVSGDTVTLDFNHPLAGATLDFTVDVVDIRDATEEELAQGCPAETMDDCCDCDDEDCEGCSGCDDGSCDDEDCDDEACGDESCEDCVDEGGADSGDESDERGESGKNLAGVKGGGCGCGCGGHSDDEG